MPIQQCTHVFPDAHVCGSPALRGERLCYYHHPRRHPSPGELAKRRAHRGFSITPPTTRQELRRALGQILQRLSTNQLDVHRASLLLYTLQITGLTLP